MKTIELNRAENISGLNRVKWAEGLILQLPVEHEGRNSWLLNYGIGDEAVLMRKERGLMFDNNTQSCELSYVQTGMDKLVRHISSLIIKCITYETITLSIIGHNNINNYRLWIDGKSTNIIINYDILENLFQCGYHVEWIR